MAHNDNIVKKKVLPSWDQAVKQKIIHTHTHQPLSPLSHVSMKQAPGPWEMLNQCWSSVPTMAPPPSLSPYIPILPHPSPTLLDLYLPRVGTCASTPMKTGPSRFTSQSGTYYFKLSLHSFASLSSTYLSTQSFHSIY